jgi:hypothetical protein
MDDAVLPEIPGCEIVDEDKIDWAEERDWEGGYEGGSEHTAHWTDELLSILFRCLEVQEDICWASFSRTSVEDYSSTHNVK